MLMYYNGYFFTKNPSQTLTGKMSKIVKLIEKIIVLKSWDLPNREKIRINKVIKRTFIINQFNYV